jgi:hypothetical protein
MCPSADCPPSIVACIRKATGDTALPLAWAPVSVPLANDVLVRHHTELIAHALLQYLRQLRFSYLIERHCGSMNDIAAPN